MKYPLLHETLKVGSIVLKNRLVMPPMLNGMGDFDGKPGADHPGTQFRFA